MAAAVEEETGALSVGSKDILPESALIQIRGIMGAEAQEEDEVAQDEVATVEVEKGTIDIGIMMLMAVEGIKGRTLVVEVEEVKEEVEMMMLGMKQERLVIKDKTMAGEIR